jgi:hypothetical protein
VRSYLADGRVVRLRPAPGASGRWAVDAELATQAVPPALARRTGIADPARFWPLWTRAEVACKLLDVSILVWLRRYGLEPPPLPGIRIGTHLLDDVVISVGTLSA